MNLLIRAQPLNYLILCTIHRIPFVVLNLVTIIFKNLFSFSGRILMMDHDVKLEANIGYPD